MKNRLSILLLSLLFVVNVSAQTTSQSDFFGFGNTNTSAYDFKKNSFGLDFGIGSVKDYDGTIIDLGFRYLHNFSPYVGWDVFKLKTNVNLEADDLIDGLLPQLMTGVRGNIPLAGNISLMGNVKMGYGYMIDAEAGGMCHEFEIGINLTRTIFIAYAYNFQGGSMEVDQYNSRGRVIGSTDVDIKSKYSALRIGFNF